MVSPAFVDLRCNSSEPGYEHRETLKSLNRCAMSGGYAYVALLPNCLPVRDDKAGIEFVIHHTERLDVNFLPLGAITHNLNSDDLCELYDMKQSGAAAFSNANTPLDNIGSMSRAMQYSKSFDGLIYSFCDEPELCKGAFVAEGPVAVSLGLKGKPQMAEFLRVQRDVELADYHQSRIHISKISTEKSVEIIRQAKAQGIQVSCDVAIMNLALTDEAIMDFDSNLKLNPPLRQASDVKALWSGLLDGTIDAICSDHHPQEIEHKKVEFEYASNGAISIQIAMSIGIEGRNRFCPTMSDEKLFSKFNYGGAKVLGIELEAIEEGSSATLTVINPNKQTILTKKSNHSGSDNTYYLNKPLPYFIEATFLNDNCLFNTNHH
ncbi:MAG: amidohydrolase family protein [Bacteroidia bacterium]|nr:amidohydrolase family protein [Bacteroidia bacterium]